MINNNINNINNIAIEHITGNYYYGRYGTFNVIIDISSGYINATHLCNQTNNKNGTKKEFKHWKQNNTTTELINEISLSLGICRDDLFKLVTEGQTFGLRGSYVHPDLIPHIACWASPKFAIAVMKIVNHFIVERELRRRYMVISNNILDHLAVATLRDDITNASLPADRKLQCVYFISAAEFTKIGYTCNLPKRLMTLQTCNPVQLVVSHKLLTRYPIEVETDLHEIFAEYNVGGEWFKLPTDYIDRVKELYD